MAVSVAYSDDDNGNMGAVVEYKANNESTWKTAFTPYIDRLPQVWQGEGRNLAPNPNYRQVRTSIFGLSRNTSYNVRVTFNDADGVTGTNPVTGSATTWSHDQAATGGTTYYVNSSGGDDNADGLTLSTAWKTISKADNTVAPGDTVKLIGTFAGFTWTKSGTSEAYVKIESNNHESAAIISSLTTITANYVWITYITFNASVRTTGSQYLLFQYNTLHNYSGSFIGNFGMVSGSVLGTLLEYNTIYNDSIPSDESGTGIYINSSATGRVVIRYNTIHTAYDGIGGSGNYCFQCGADEGSDIHNNNIYDCYDDGIEQEGGNINVKIFNNYIHDAASPGYGRVGIATAPIEIGPAFILNNVVYNTGYGFKLGYGMGKGYFINNTVWKVSEAGAASSGGSAANLEFYNNIFYVTANYVFENSDSYSTGWTVNYNNFDSTGISQVKWLGTSITYSFLRSNFGQETNGKNIASNLVNPPANMSIKSKSGLKDAGKSFNGIAFDYSGNPRLGVWDIGAYEYIPKIPNPPSIIEIQ